MLAEGELKAALEEYSPSSVIVKQLQSKVDFLRKLYDKAQSGGMFKNDNFCHIIIIGEDIIWIM